MTAIKPSLTGLGAPDEWQHVNEGPAHHIAAGSITLNIARSRLVIKVVAVRRLQSRSYVKVAEPGLLCDTRGRARCHPGALIGLAYYHFEHRQILPRPGVFLWGRGRNLRVEPWRLAQPVARLGHLTDIDSAALATTAVRWRSVALELSSDGLTMPPCLEAGSE